MCVAGLAVVPVCFRCHLIQCAHPSAPNQNQHSSSAVEQNPTGGGKCTDGSTLSLSGGIHHLGDDLSACINVKVPLFCVGAQAG